MGVSQLSGEIDGLLESIGNIYIGLKNKFNPLYTLTISHSKEKVKDLIVPGGAPNSTRKFWRKTLIRNAEELADKDVEKYARRS